MPMLPILQPPFTFNDPFQDFVPTLGHKLGSRAQETRSIQHETNGIDPANGGVAEREARRGHSRDWHVVEFWIE
jgi:hypothetical protein